MKKYEVIGISVRLAPNQKVILSDKLAERRKHNLLAVKGENNTYIVMNIIEFKRGETFSCENELNPKLGKVIEIEKVVCVEDKLEDKPKKKSKKQIKAEKKAQVKKDKLEKGDESKSDEGQSEEELLDVLG